MKSKLFLAIIILVAAVGYFIFFVQRSPEVNPTREEVLELLNLDCESNGVPELYRSCMLEISKQQDSWTAQVTYDGFFDDSVRAGRTKALIRYENERWVLGDVLQTFQCWPGRGHQDFSTELCV